jgi:hypothetical protein
LDELRLLLLFFLSAQRGVNNRKSRDDEVML